MSQVKDLLGSIAFAKYHKYAASPDELKAAFKKAVTALDDDLKVEAELDYFVRMAESIISIEKNPKSRKRIETQLGYGLPKTINEAIGQRKFSGIKEIRMLTHFIDGFYEIDAQVEPWLVEQIRREPSVSAADDLGIMIDIALVESCRFMDAIFVGGMNCERIISPRALGSRLSTQRLLANVSKVRTELTDRLIESLSGASKEILIAAWLGRFIVPELKKCVERDIELRLITHKPEDAERTTGFGDKADAFKELSTFLNSDSVRLLPSCHARMVVIDERVAFVGSMDLDSPALAERDEVAIMSDDPSVVGQARKIFEELFSKGTRPKW